MTKKRVTCTGMTKQLYEQTFVSFLGQVVETRFNDFLGFAHHHHHHLVFLPALPVSALKTETEIFRCLRGMNGKKEKERKRERREKKREEERRREKKRRRRKYGALFASTEDEDEAQRKPRTHK